MRADNRSREKKNWFRWSHKFEQEIIHLWNEEDFTAREIMERFQRRGIYVTKANIESKMAHLRKRGLLKKRRSRRTRMPHAADAKQKEPPRIRLCMNCKQKFESKGKFNRLCYSYNILAADMPDYDYYLHI